MRLNGDDFADRGLAYKQAWVILLDCDIPPSFEVFEHGLAALRTQSGISVTPQEYAQRLVNTYRRIR